MGNVQLTAVIAQSVDWVTAQDTVTLQPIQPASGLSACPGQDVTLNCTIVRMTTIPLS